jgi:DedD protein
MDRGLQERLIGAAVLVALGVWLIPWVLDGSAVSEPSPAQTVALKLPTPDDGGGTVIRRQTIDLSADRGTLLKAQGSESHAADRAAAAGDSGQQARSAAPVVSAPQESVTSQDRAAPGSGVRRQAADSPAQNSLRADAAVAAPASASLQDIITASAVVGWMVQSGSFSNAGNARRQAERIETVGHDARIYEFAAAGGRTMFRVRVGPLETRERAEATASSLAAHGFVAQLVAPE